jgi:vitamin B12 transporter
MVDRSLFLLLVLSVASPAVAQQAADTARLVPVVITATRIPVKVSDASQAVTVLNGTELRERGIVRLSDALREVPGLAVVQSGPPGAITAVFARGGESDYMKVLIDGVAVNAAGGAFDFAHLTTDNIDRIEIVRGPASVLYGSDAVAGVVQIFTRRADAATGRLDGAVRGGSNASLDGDLVLSGRRPLRFTLGASRRVTDGIYDFNNRYENTTTSAQLDRRFVQGALSFSGRHLEAEYHYPTDGSGVPVDSNAVRRERRTVLALAGSRRLFSRATAHVQLSSNQVHAVSDDQPDFATDASFSHDQARSQRRAADVRVDVGLPVHGTVSLGYEYQHQREERTGTSSFGDALPFDETRFNHGYYGQLVAGPADRASLVMGGRVDDNEKFGIFRTGRAAASLRLIDGARVRGAVGTAFKEPAFDEVYTTTFTTGNPDLRPERSTSVEVGADFSLGGEYATVGITAFRQDFRDMIQYVGGAAPDFLGHNENLAAARSSGVEVELQTRPTNRLTASAAYTYLETSVRDAGNGAFGAFEAGKALLRRPKHSGSARLTYRTRAGGSASLALQHVGRRDDYDFNAGARVALPSYGRVDVGAEVPGPGRTGGLASSVLTLRVDNLLNREYEPVLNFRAPGRLLLVGVRFGVTIPSLRRGPTVRGLLSEP